MNASRAGACTASGRRSSALSKLNTAVFTPTARPSTSTVPIANEGRLAIARSV
jgi:hypothetical protein